MIIFNLCSEYREMIYFLGLQLVELWEFFLRHLVYTCNGANIEVQNHDTAYRIYGF